MNGDNENKPRNSIYPQRFTCVNNCTKYYTLNMPHSLQLQKRHLFTMTDLLQTVSVHFHHHLIPYLTYEPCKRQYSKIVTPSGITNKQQDGTNCENLMETVKLMFGDRLSVSLLHVHFLWILCMICWWLKAQFRLSCVCMRHWHNTSSQTKPNAHLKINAEVCGVYWPFTLLHQSPQRKALSKQT